MFGRRFNGVNDYSHDAPLEIMNETEWSKIQDQMIIIIYPSLLNVVPYKKDLLKERMDRRVRVSSSRKVILLCLNVLNVLWVNLLVHLKLNMLVRI